MGAWSAAILGNDTSCEVHERFLEFYDFGEDPESIAKIILEEQKENIECDRTNVWFGLAMACWECKVLTKEVYEEVKGIVDSKEDITFNKELDADSDFLKKRQKVLDDFIKKISKGKEKARLRKKVPIQIESFYTPGMCLTYKNSDGKYIGIYIIESEHYRNKGRIEFWFLDVESDTVPDISTFENARLFGLDRLGPSWGDREYRGNVTDLNYEKATKANFFINVPKVLTFVGKLRVCDNVKITNNYSGGFTKPDDPARIIQILENVRTGGKLKHNLSALTLNELLDKIAI